MAGQGKRNCKQPGFHRQLTNHTKLGMFIPFLLEIVKLLIEAECIYLMVLKTNNTDTSVKSLWVLG